jgi:biofilm PGA synthesis N-glycosyltransferase PgaC
MSSQIVAIVPAYNEASTILATIDSLSAQTRPPDVIAVVPNNCSDNTADVAYQRGVYVIEMANNPHQKAGAINHALDLLDPYLDDDAAVFIMDADTELCADALAVGEQLLGNRVGGVSCSFLGRPAKGLLGYLQRMEFYRYAATPERHGGRAFVLSGTGTLFRMAALREVGSARLAGNALPHGKGWYDTHSLTEDNELSLALLTLGWQALAPPGMTNTTDVMESVGKLDHQRHRWFLGALRNIAQYGLKLPWHLRWTYWRQQVGLALSAAVTATYLVLLSAMLVQTGGIYFSPWWLLPTVILVVERIWSVWRMGWRARLVAAAVVPEQLYTLLLLYIFARATLTFLRGGKGTWVAT